MHQSFFRDFCKYYFEYPLNVFSRVFFRNLNRYYSYSSRNSFRKWHNYKKANTNMFMDFAVVWILLIVNSIYWLYSLFFFLNSMTILNLLEQGEYFNFEIILKIPSWTLDLCKMTWWSLPFYRRFLRLFI